MHAPPWHCSPSVQASPSEQGVKSSFWNTEQLPVSASQDGEWHASLGHTFGFPVHTPAWQVSVCVHWLKSVHAVPFGFGGLLHKPVTESHVPGAWHWSP